MLGSRFVGRAARVRQHDITDCGAACLASVAAHYGYRLPLARIRQYAGTDQQGTSVLGLVEAATRLGFSAKGVRGPFESLPAVPLPAIAHVLVGGVLFHYLTVYRVTARHVVVMDPADGRVHRLSHPVFQKQWSGVLVLLVPAQSFHPGNHLQSPLSRLAQLVRPHRAVILQALVGSVVTTLLGLSGAIYVQKIVDHVLPGGDARLLRLLTTAMLALLVAQVLLGWIKDVLVLRTGQRIDAQLILGYYRHLLRLPQRFFDTMRVGEITSRVSDAVKIRAFINEVALDLLVSALVVVFSLALAFAYSWKLGMLMVAALPVYGLIYAAANRANRVTERTVMETAADLEARLVESLTAIGTVRRLGVERFVEREVESRLVQLLRPVYRSGTNALFAGHSADLTARLATIALLWVGTVQVLAQSLTPGALMSCYALLGYLTGPMSSLISANRSVQEAVIAADRLFEIMDLEQEGGGGRIDLTPTRMGDICLEDVVFRYGARATVFDGLCATVRRGQLTGVVGESGSGKSTLSALLLGLYPLDAGRIRIGGVDLRQLSTASLRRAIGVVPQRIELFAGNVVENIAPGEFDPNMDVVLDLCDELGITEFVERLPDGFATHLGENGALLSGGQRQRIAIARALYRSPQVLILDEATSSLDPVSERFVQRAIRRLRDRGRTVVVIAHRLSSLQSADCILVLEAGRVAEQGSHQELMRRRGSYFRLWRHQFTSSGDDLDATPEGEAAPGGHPSGDGWAGTPQRVTA